MELVTLFKRSFSPDPLGAGKSPDLFKNLSLREIAKRRLHHGKDHFINPFNAQRHRNFWEVLRWKLFNKNRFRSFYKDEKVIPIAVDWEMINKNSGLSITYLKHASLMIKDIDRYFLIDPIFFDLWPLTDFTPLAFDVRSMPKPHHILITHGHYDHLDTRSLSLFKNHSHFITPLGYNDLFEGFKRSQLDWFDTYKDKNREIILIPCDHWTMRKLFLDFNTSLWGSFIIKTRSGPTIFISGDCAYFNRFQEIGREFSIDLAIVNLGAYEPRWFMAKSHLNPSEAVQTFKELNARRLMIVHWGTFRLGDEPVYLPPLAIRREMEKKNLVDCLIEIKHGQTLIFSEEF